MGIKRHLLWRVYLAFGFICLAGFAIMFQSFHIQMVEGEYWRAMADSLTTGYRSIEPERGNIKTEDDRLLATSIPFFEIRMDANSDALTSEAFYSNVANLARAMSEHFMDLSPLEYKRKLVNARESGERYLLIRRKVTYPELQKIKQWPLFRLGKFKGGLIVVQQNKRLIPFRMLAHRTIGYVREGVQPVGLEGAFDHVLAGVHGKRLMQRIAGGVWIPLNDDNEIEPIRGKDIICTIDINIQDIAEHALLKSLEKHHADHGCVVVMEARTGKIKAIANLGQNEDGDFWENYNFAVGESSEHGSTFKLASLLALLKDDMVDVTDLIDLEKGIKKYYNETIKDSESHELREVTVQEAFERSSNVGISKLINEYYSKKPGEFIKHLRKLRLHEKCGIEIQGEAKPFIKTPQHKDWSGVSLPFMSIGYEVKVTPLQLLTLYNAVANNGTMMKPYLISEIREFGQTSERFDPVVLQKKICSKTTLTKIKSLLEGVVERGTAKNIRSDKYRIAGKTGTAKIADAKHGYRKVYQSSFAGYFPAENPMYSCIVVISEPRSGAYYGSSVAAPVFKEISDKVFANSINMHRPVNEGDSTSPEIPYAKAGHIHDIMQVYDKLNVPYQTQPNIQWVYSSKNDSTMELKERKIIKGLVPDVTGMGLKSALHLLGNMGLNVTVAGKGRVKRQSLKIGTRVNKGDNIRIELG